MSHGAGSRGADSPGTDKHGTDSRGAGLPSPDARLYPTRPLLAASLAVIRADRVLLAKRAVAPLAGCFTLPGGLVEPGETLSAAALREMHEEVGVEARIIGFNRHVEVIERDHAGGVMRHYVIASFVGAWIAGEGAVGPEAEAVAWVRHDEVAAYPTTEHLPPLLDAAFAMMALEGRRC